MFSSEDTLGRTELTDLYAVIIGTGQHHYDAVQNAGNACAQYIVAFLGGDGLYVHDGLGIGVILSGSYDVDLQIVYQLLRIYALLLDAFADVKGGALYLGLGTALYFGDLKVLAGEGANDLLLYLFLCGSGRACYCGRYYGAGSTGELRKAPMGSSRSMPLPSSI